MKQNSKTFEYELDFNMKKLPQSGYLSVKPISVIMLTLGFMTAHNSVLAGERESLEQLRSTTVNLVNLLVQEGVLSKDKAGALLKQAEQDAVKAKEKDATATPVSTRTPASNADSVDTAIDQKMVHVQYVPEIVKKQMKEEIKDEVMTRLTIKRASA